MCHAVCGFRCHRSQTHATRELRGGTICSLYETESVVLVVGICAGVHIIHSWISVRRPSADLGHAHRSNAFANGASALPGALPSMPVRSEPTAHVLPQHAQASHPQPVLLIATTIVYRCDQPGFSRNPTTRLPPCLTVPFRCPRPRCALTVLRVVRRLRPRWIQPCSCTCPQMTKSRLGRGAGGRHLLFAAARDSALAEK